MPDVFLPVETELTDLDANAWFARIDDISEDRGYFEHLGAKHFAGFIGAGNRLLVTFENAQSVRANNAGAESRGFGFVRNEGWSHLAIYAAEESWFREQTIYDFFDRLSDEGFFDDFERIVFYGAHGGGYAAAAYSVAAPGSTVIAIRPQATLEPGMTSWDSRYKAQRRQNFGTRYGYAPDMIDAAQNVFVAYDPVEHLDAMHAVLFRNANVTLLPCTLLGADLDVAFDRMGIQDVMIKLAMDGTLDRKRFSQLLRARRYDETYVQSLVQELLRKRHQSLAIIICNYMLKRGQNRFFEMTLKQLKQ